MNFGEIFGNTAMSLLTPILATLITVLIPIAITALFQWLKKIGIDIEEKHQRALQSALHNAAMVAINRATGQAGPLPPDTYVKKVIEVVPNVGAGIDYVLNSVPDAVKEFKLDTSRIKDLLEPHIAEAARRVGVTTKSN